MTWFASWLIEEYFFLRISIFIEYGLKNLSHSYFIRSILDSTNLRHYSRLIMHSIVIIPDWSSYWLPLIILLWITLVSTLHIRLSPSVRTLTNIWSKQLVDWILLIRISDPWTDIRFANGIEAIVNIVAKITLILP